MKFLPTAQGLKVSPTGTDGLDVTLPVTANGPMRIASRIRADVWIELTANDLAPVHVAIQPGIATYSNAGNALDVVQLPFGGGVEEVRILRTAEAPSTIHQLVRHGSGVSSVRVRDEHVQVLDTEGVVCIESSLAVAIDANGEHRPATVQLVGNVLTIALDTRGLAFPVAFDPQWSALSPMATARLAHAMVYVPVVDRVLVVGGNTTPDGDPTAASEFLGITSKLWVAGKSMTEARAAFAASLLPSNELLVAGGIGATGDALKSSELFQVVGGGWTSAGTMNDARYGSSAVLLASGDVLVAGGAELSKSAEIWNASTRTWTRTAPMTEARMYSTATLLSSGRVLVAGGFDKLSGGTVSRTTELYDPTTGVWTSGPPMSAARARHGAVAIADGKVLIVGGNQLSDAVAPALTLASAEIYDSKTNAWTTAPSMADDRAAFGITALKSGAVIVVGGFKNDLGNLDSAEAYDSTTNKWSSLPVSGARRQSPAVVGLPDGTALVTGGTGGGGVSASAAIVVLSNGDTCPGILPCGSGQCVDGVCCDSGCTEACQACDIVGSVGKCSLVNGNPHGARLKCTPSEGSCVSATFTAPSSCDGTSTTCKPGTSKTCGNYACRTTGCVSKCATTSDCADGFICAGESCVPQPAATCPDGIHSIDTTGKVRDCSPFVCQSDGNCHESCGTTDDCVTGYVCADKTCVPVANDDGAGDGGGCQASRSEVPSFAVIALTMLAGVGALARHRRRSGKANTFRSRT